MIDVEKINKEIRYEVENTQKKLATSADIEKVLSPMLGPKWEFSFQRWCNALIVAWSSEDGSRASVNDMMFATSVIETRWPGSRNYTGAYAGNEEGVFTVWRQFYVIEGEVKLEIHVQGKNVRDCEVKFSKRPSTITDVMVGAACLGLPEIEPAKDPS